MVTNLVASPGPLSWRLTWSSTLDSPTYRVFRDGVLVATTTNADAVISVRPGEAPRIDVFDDDDDVPAAESYPDFATLTWGPSPGAATYRVEQLVTNRWVPIATIAVDDPEQTYFEFRSGRLADDTTHTFRVVPVTAAGIDGIPREHSLLMVRMPDTPVVDYVFDPRTSRITAKVR